MGSISNDVTVDVIVLIKKAKDDKFKKCKDKELTVEELTDMRLSMEDVIVFKPGQATDSPFADELVSSKLNRPFALRSYSVTSSLNRCPINQ